MEKFGVIRIHRSVAAGIGAFAGSVDVFTGLVFGICWLIGEVMGFVIFEHKDETSE